MDYQWVLLSPPSLLFSDGWPRERQTFQPWLWSTCLFSLRRRYFHHGSQHICWTHFKNFQYYPLNIEFTLEKQVGGAINFLDVSITRKQNQKLFFNWYRKPTWSGRYLNFNSAHPLRYKKSVINNLVDRAILLSDKKFQKNNLKLITDTLRKMTTHLVSHKTLLTRDFLPLNKKHD